MRCLLFAALLGAIAMVPRLGAMSLPAGQPLCARVDEANCVIVGKVTAIEDKEVQLNKTPHRIAVVQIGEGLVGSKGLTHVRVAFRLPPPPLPPLPPPPPAQPGQPQPLMIRSPVSPSVNLKVGDEGIFILKQQSGETFFVFAFPDWTNFIPKTAPRYEQTLAAAKRVAKLRDDPAAGLKAKTIEDRLTAAMILLARHQKTAKTQPVDAEQSKHILLALADAPWNESGFFADISAGQGFAMLRLTPQDGWNPPRQGNRDFRVFQKEYETAAKKWLKDHAGSYRLKR